MIRIASIERESTVDGEGWRYVIFTQGCNHNCKGCHNPQSHDFDGGKEVTDQELLDDILSNPLLDGVTLSGGDPFFQADKLLNLVKACKEQELTVWAYTGFIFDEFIKFKNNLSCDKRITSDMLKLLKYIDIVVDGPFILNKKSMNCLYRGSTNQRLINVKESLKHNKIVEYKITE